MVDIPDETLRLSFRRALQGPNRKYNGEVGILWAKTIFLLCPDICGKEWWLAIGLYCIVKLPWNDYIYVATMNDIQTFPFICLWYSHVSLKTTPHQKDARQWQFVWIQERNFRDFSMKNKAEGQVEFLVNLLRLYVQE